MKKLLMILVLALGCSAGDVEDVGSLEQALNTCSLTVTDPVRSGSQIFWRVTNTGPGCNSSNAARTELYKFCGGCSVKKVMLYSFQPIILGPRQSRDFAAAWPATCHRASESIVADASWLPTGSTTRRHASPSGNLACP